MLLHYLEHDVGNSSNSYKYFCDDQFFALKKVNRTFLDIFLKWIQKTSFGYIDHNLLTIYKNLKKYLYSVFPSSTILVMYVISFDF